jgi:hydrogenase nickel incorporation protein HypA/HybF
LAHGVVAVALDAARRAGASRVNAVEIVVGASTGGADVALRTCFEVAALGTIAEGAVLTVRFEPAVVECLACAATAAVWPPLPEACASCGSGQIIVTGGRSFRVEAIDIDCDIAADIDQEVDTCASTS